VDGELLHGGNPVLRWMASNVSIKPDTAGNIKPDKAASCERIDGIVAAVMAIGLATTDSKRPFVYAHQGIRTL
jgi:phage terminase large subunit-like protein